MKVVYRFFISYLSRTDDNIGICTYAHHNLIKIVRTFTLAFIIVRTHFWTFVHTRTYIAGTVFCSGIFRWFIKFLFIFYFFFILFSEHEIDSVEYFDHFSTEIYWGLIKRFLKGRNDFPKTFNDAYKVLSNYKAKDINTLAQYVKTG